MLVIPQQNWEVCRADLDRDVASWVRSSSSVERFQLYKELFGLIWNARGNDFDSNRVDEWLLNQKVETRQKLLLAFTELDRLHRERSAETNSA